MFNVGIQHKGTYLLVVASGSAELPELFALADFAARVAVMRNIKRVLVDLLAVQRDLSPAEQSRLIGHLASAFSGLERVASVHQKSHEFPGLPVRTFLTLGAASEWLLDCAGDPASS